MEAIEPPVCGAPCGALRRSHREYANAAVDCSAELCGEEPSRVDERQARAMGASVRGDLRAAMLITKT
jgi:hypothetical protein